MTRPFQPRKDGKPGPVSKAKLTRQVLSPSEGKIGEEHLRKDRQFLFVTEDGRELTKYSRGQLRPINLDVWFTYFKPPVYIRESR